MQTGVCDACCQMAHGSRQLILTQRSERSDWCHGLGWSMAAAEERDGRNFRQTYYEKVGFKGVEEKRSLEMILNERPLDVNRLTQFTSRFNLPHVHRERVWLLLLGPLSPSRPSSSY